METMQEELKVTIQDSTLVFPSQETQNRSFFLSTLDQILTVNIQAIYFFQPNPDFTPQVVAQRMKLALQRVLVPYDFMAGRLKRHHHSSRLEINCNMAGAGFVVASSEFSLDEIGDLVFPNPGFRQLDAQTLNHLDADDQPLCVFQVTSFKCGGFSIGMSFNHSLLDGTSAKIFLENLASQAFEDKPLAFIPCHDRNLLAARSPPHVEFPHPEYLKIDIGPFLASPLLMLHEFQKKMEIKILKLSSKDINFLKLKSKAEEVDDDHNATTTAKRRRSITTFNVVAALIWRSRALSLNDKDREFTVLTSVDIRQRLKPPLPLEYCGNAVLVAYASAKCKDIEQRPFWKLVELIADGHNRMTDEYVRSTIDWFETNKGIPFGDCHVTSWLRMELHQVEFPWGKPLCSTPLVNHLVPFNCILPDVDGVSIMSGQPVEEMESFQYHFHNFLANTS
ncbi:hypothetical protein ABFS82_11G001800 [Erythranthe guttata]|uniref:shikimate O-hydroxycinnamoyltransferase-like n=1 Tax=Erythranthe guttata TaxID=4155 RepID=UPI00064E0DDD|nr:PREDICTED: shikimate O-hydroxycinnamoyltransferase-like [Erythranthe guttata]|eukprot:XP_012857302.1 PREDICTED: shikimate O-hydroxycinnamoyltransferase-like [Erythranthe guttata]